jgi:hypothetical protein
MFKTKVVEKNQNTHFVFNNFVSFSQIVPFNQIMWKNIGRSGQATDDNMAHAHCILDN